MYTLLRRQSISRSALICAIDFLHIRIEINNSEDTSQEYTPY